PRRGSRRGFQNFRQLTCKVRTDRTTPTGVAMPQITDLASVRQARLNRSHNPDKTFTSWKFDVLNCLFVAPRLDATAKIVAVFILQHVNQHTGAAFPGIETISDGTAIS